MIEVEIPGFADLKRRSSASDLSNVPKKLRSNTEEDVRYAATKRAQVMHASFDGFRSFFFDGSRRNCVSRQGSDGSAHTSSVDLLLDLEDEGEEPDVADSVERRSPATVTPIKAAMNPCNTFSLLSPHLHVYIIGFVAEPSDLCNVKLVNRRWHQYGEANELWTNFAPALISPTKTPQTSVANVMALQAALGSSVHTADGSPLPYIAITSRDQLAKLWCDASVEAKKQSTAQQRTNSAANDGRAAVTASSSPLLQPTQSQHDHHENGRKPWLTALQSSTSPVHDDANHCYIRWTLQHMERAQALSWGCIYKGWEWLRTEFRAALRHAWCQQLEHKPDQPFYQSISKQQGMHRAFKKLFSNDWGTLYHCIKDEMKIQTQCMARDICMACSENRSASDNSTRLSDASKLLATVCSAFNIFSNWVTEMEEVLWRIDEKISNEAPKLKTVQPRAREATATSPLIQDVAMLAFRNEVLFYNQLHSHIVNAVAVLANTLDLRERQRILASTHSTSAAVVTPTAHNHHLCFTDDELREDYISQFASSQHHFGQTPSMERKSDTSDPCHDIEGLLVQFYRVVLALDLADDETNFGRKTHGALRRLFLIPLRHLEQISVEVRDIDAEHRRQSNGAFESAMVELCQSDSESRRKRRCYSAM